LVIALAGLVLIPTASRATLIDNGAFSTDTDIGLDWLKLGALAGFSYNQVSAGALGYTTSGWRYATQSEIVDLFTLYIGAQNNGYTNWSNGPNAVSSAYFDDAYDLVLKLGMNVAFNDSRATVNSLVYPDLHQITVQGIFNDGLPGDPRQGFAEATAVIVDDEFSGANCFSASVPCGRWGVTTNFIPSNNNSTVRSSFLVRSTPVPEPTNITLLAFGLAGLGFKRRR